VDRWRKSFDFVYFKEVKYEEEMSKKLSDVRWVSTSS